MVWCCSIAQVPTAAANALKRMGEGAAPHVAAVLARCDQLARAAVTEALVRIGGSAAADAAAELLEHEDSAVRQHAAEVIGLVGPSP